MCYVDERGGIGIRLELAAAIVWRYGEQFRRETRRKRTGTRRPKTGAVAAGSRDGNLLPKLHRRSEYSAVGGERSRNYTMSSKSLEGEWLRGLKESAAGIEVLRSRWPNAGEAR
jgi:hypothetical protein